MNILKKYQNNNKELQRRINLEVTLQKDLKEKLEDENLLRIESYEEGTVYYWNIETFHNRYDLIII